MFEEGAEEELDEESQAQRAADPDYQAFTRPTDVQKARAKKAFEVI